MQDGRLKGSQNDFILSFFSPHCFCHAIITETIILLLAFCDRHFDIRHTVSTLFRVEQSSIKDADSSKEMTLYWWI